MSSILKYEYIHQLKQGQFSYQRSGAREAALERGAAYLSHQIIILGSRILRLSQQSKNLEFLNKLVGHVTRGGGIESQIVLTPESPNRFSDSDLATLVSKRSF